MTKTEKAILELLYMLMYDLYTGIKNIEKVSEYRKIISQIENGTYESNIERTSDWKGWKTIDEKSS